MLDHVLITRYIEDEEQATTTLQEALAIIRKEYRPKRWTSQLTISLAECRGTYHTTPIEGDGKL